MPVRSGIRLALGFVLAFAFPASGASGGDELVWPGAVKSVEDKLASGDVHERRAAAAQLDRLPLQVLRRLLPKLFADPDPEVRLQVAEAALSVRLPEAGPRVVAWLNDPDARVRQAAAEVLGVLPQTGSASALGRVLEDAEPSVRAAAAAALGTSDAPDASSFLLGRLDDSDPEVRHAVIGALEDLGDPRAVVPLIGRIQEQRAPLRRQAVLALGSLGDGRAASALIVALGDTDATVRAAAASALGRLRAPDAVWSLGALLDTESDPDVQGALLEALGAIGSPSSVDAIVRTATRRHWSGPRIEDALARAGERALPSLERCVFQPIHPAAAQSCVSALGEIGGTRARQLLVRVLREGLSEPARALEALGRAGDAAGLPAVLEHLSARDPMERRAAIDATDRLLSPERRLGLAVEPIVQELGRTRGARLERGALIGLLGRTGSPRAAASLIPIAASDDEYLRAIAIEALGQLGPAGADPMLLNGLDAASFPTRWTAAIALRRVGTRTSVAPLLERLERASARDGELAAIALAGPIADAVSDEQLRRIRQIFDASSGEEKDALIDALGAVPGKRGSAALQELLPGLTKASRAKLAEALGAHPDARSVLRELASDSDPAVRANAVWSLGAAATQEDVPFLTQLIADPDVAVACDAVGALVRTTSRLKLTADTVLCSALADSRNYVLVNALAGLRLTGVQCSSAPPPSWLLAHHPSDEVRLAAARWIVEQPEQAKAQKALLERCARKDVSGRVAAECSTSAAAPPAHGEDEVALGVSVLVVPTGDTAPLARAPFALIRSDGLVRCGTSDRRGSVSEALGPRGALRLAVPAVFSE